MIILNERKWNVLNEKLKPKKMKRFDSKELLSLQFQLKNDQVT